MRWESCVKGFWTLYLIHGAIDKENISKQISLFFPRQFFPYLIVLFMRCREMCKKKQCSERIKERQKCIGQYGLSFAICEIKFL